VDSGAFWSTAHQPTRRRPTAYEAILSEGRAEFRRRDAIEGGGDIETYTEIVVSPEDDIELRRVRLTNRSPQRREIEVTLTEAGIVPYVRLVGSTSSSDLLDELLTRCHVKYH